MKAYYSEGGRQNPDFPHCVRVNQCTEEMYKWCLDYDDQNQPFCRFYVKWNLYDDPNEYDYMAFEQEQPALMFTLTFGKA